MVCTTKETLNSSMHTLYFNHSDQNVSYSIWVQDFINKDKYFFECFSSLLAKSSIQNKTGCIFQSDDSSNLVLSKLG